jgi:hypothetical protein
VTLERRVTAKGYHPAPYLSAEFFYQSMYHKWSTTALYAGCLFPIGKHFELDPITNTRTSLAKARISS